MKAICRALAVSALAITFSAGVAFTQDHPDNHGQDQHARDQHSQDQHGQEHHQYVHHDDWKKGHRINHDDWNRGEVVSDWHAHHLRQPPRGYEWRMIDGNYVLANPDGVIFSVTIAPH